ncbi:MAG: AbrB/MazE/SpoVT family DNA-binding domain-containing protein [Candidatus Nanoarchaeia archaeon]|nr:AbrB/MazE/SpoVT family DNA-binding domain-containing protein [Candidatus Nanoarchaeia archaeon]
MKRKIIKQGHNTLTITLPTEWTKKLNLKAGDEISLLEKDNGIFVTSERGTDEKRKGEIDLDGFDIPTIWKYFMAVYREGYDEVYVKFNPDMRIESPYKFFTQHKLDMKYGKESEKKTVLEFLHELVNRFIGFEIMDYGKDFVIIRDISEPTYKEFENSLRRIFLLVQQMAEETERAVKEDDKKILSHIHDVDINLDKFHDYCIRVLNKKGTGESRKNSLLFSTLYLLELVGDDFKNISHHLLHDFSKTDFKNLAEVAESIRKQIDLYYALYYKFDAEKIKEMSSIDKERYFDMLKLYKNTKTEEEKEIFHHFRIITRYLNALMELRIEMEY